MRLGRFQPPAKCWRLLFCTDAGEARGLSGWLEVTIRLVRSEAQPGWRPRTPAAASRTPTSQSSSHPAAAPSSQLLNHPSRPSSRGDHLGASPRDKSLLTFTPKP